MRKVTTLLWAIGLTAFSVVIIGLGIGAYQQAVRIYDEGEEGILTVEASLGTRKQRRGATFYRYDAEISGVQVRIEESQILRVGARYPVIFDREKLRVHLSKGFMTFSGYVIGRKSDSKWAVFVSSFGEVNLWLIVGVEVLMIIGSWAAWNAYRRSEEF